MIAMFKEDAAAQRELRRQIAESRAGEAERVTTKLIAERRARSRDGDWWTTQDNVLELAGWLIGESRLTDPFDVLALIREPAKYTPEYREMREGQRA